MPAVAMAASRPAVIRGSFFMLLSFRVETPPSFPDETERASTARRQRSAS
jgi:hypothetical protein